MKTPVRRFQRRYQLALLFSLLALFGVSISAQRIWQSVPASFKEKMQSTRRATDSSVSPGKQATNTSGEIALDPAQAGLAIPQNVLPGGGGTSTGGTNSLSGTIGQGIVGTSSGGNFSLSGGFWGAISGSQCPTITISPATFPNGQLGQPYSQQLTQTGGAGTINWIFTGALPNGITLGASTGLLSGTPVATGSFPITVKVTDGNGCTKEQAYTLAIGCPNIAITPTSLPAGTVNTAYSQKLMATGGTPPYTFSLNTGSAPTGLTLMSDGTLAGTPTVAAFFSFTVKVTDAAGCTATQTCTLTVNAGPFAVSGRVVDLSGNGIAGVTLTFSNTFGGAGSAQTDAAGNWSQSGFAPGTTPSSCAANPYTVRASKSGYSFNPASQTFCVATSSLNFTGATVVTTVSAASFRGAELAQESIVAAFGLNLATKVEIASATPLPTTLAGTTVRVKDSAGTERLSPLFFVAPSQVNYQIPPGTAVGLASVTVTSGDNKISLGTINVAKVAPDLFTANASGTGVPSAYVLRIRNGLQTSERVANPDFSAIPIDLGPETDLVYLILYGGGVRNRTKPENISVNLGGLVKTLNLAQFEDGYASTNFVGLDQINVLLPRSLAGKGLVDVILTVDGKAANTVQVSIK
ncbi:MAG: putative Ig domain-containing protein [Blastocatellia bacterium]